jgi:hypothetical protein
MFLLLFTSVQLCYYHRHLHCDEMMHDKTITNRTLACRTVSSSEQSIHQYVYKTEPNARAWVVFRQA